MSDDYGDEEGRSFDLAGEFFRDTLAGLEQRKLLERAGRRAAEITIDIEQNGPLGQYVASRRGEAQEALRMLVDLDPKDAVSIVMAQSAVREFLRACEWISARMDEAAEAQHIIERDFDNEHEQAD